MRAPTGKLIFTRGTIKYRIIKRGCWPPQSRVRNLNVIRSIEPLIEHDYDLHDLTGDSSSARNAADIAYHRAASLDSIPAYGAEPHRRGRQRRANAIAVRRANITGNSKVLSPPPPSPPSPSLPSHELQNKITSQRARIKTRKRCSGRALLHILCGAASPATTEVSTAKCPSVYSVYGPGIPLFLI